MTIHGSCRGAARVVERPPDRVGWDALTAANVNAVVLGLSKDPNPKTTMLLFWPGSAAPWGAAKMPATPAAEAAVRREAEFLLEVHRRFSGDVLHTIPHRLTAFEAGLPPGCMLVQAFGGVPLSVDYVARRHVTSPVRVSHDISIVSRWLRDIQNATTQSSDRIAIGEQVLDSLRTRFPADVRTARVLHALDPAAREFLARRGPKSVVHGDLWLGNILIDTAGVTGVIDWESAQLCGEPLRDVARFGLTYALYLDRSTRPGRVIRGHGVRAGEWGVGVRYLLRGNGWFPELLRGFVCRAMSRLGADPAYWRELLLLGLADIAATADDEAWAERHLELLDLLGGVAS